MTKHIVCKSLGTPMLIALVLGSAVQAQIPVWQQTAADNARSGAVRGRTPGKMVGAGVARALEFANAGRAGVQIVEVAPASSFRTNAMVASIAALFEQLNQAMLVIGNLLLARSGIGLESALPASGPSSTISPDSVGDTVPPADNQNLPPSSTTGQSGGRR